MYIIAVHCFTFVSNNVSQLSWCFWYFGNTALERTSDYYLDTSSTKTEKSEEKSTKKRCNRIDRLTAKTIFAIGKSSFGCTVELCNFKNHLPTYIEQAMFWHIYFLTIKYSDVMSFPRCFQDMHRLLFLPPWQTNRIMRPF